VGVEVVVDRGQGAQEEAADIGEGGGTAGRDASLGEEGLEGDERIVDAGGVLEPAGSCGERSQEILGFAGLTLSVPRAEGEIGVDDGKQHWRPVAVRYWPRSGVKSELSELTDIFLSFTILVSGVPHPLVFGKEAATH
jgi:hypothetical protein